MFLTTPSVKYIFIVFWCILQVKSFNIDVKFPTVFQDLKKEGGNENTPSYFGFRVDLSVDPTLGHNSIVYVGKPSNGTTEENRRESVVNPGQFFSCKADGGCTEIKVTSEYNEDVRHDDEHHYKERKDFSFLGAAISVSSNGTSSLVCSHRWANQDGYAVYRMNGACYLKHPSLGDSYVPILPFLAKSLQYSVGHDKSGSSYYYALAQAGVSSHLDRMGNFIIGAPGFAQWTGTAVRVSVRNLVDPMMGSAPDLNIIVPKTTHITNLGPYSYLGYSVTSGNFINRNRLSYASGAPRGADEKGLLVLFDFPEQSEQPMIVHSMKEGSMLGEYFGAVLSSVDLNGDGLDDLLVGAPLYGTSTEYENGRVYIYINKNSGILELLETDLIGKEASRFGTSLMGLGDIDGDGYNDFAVGAPGWLDVGVVYIYHGRKSPHYVELVQTISPSLWRNNIKAFGYSLSQAVDIDNNLYPDVAVGCPVSGHVVLLKSRPVVRFFQELKSDHVSLLPIPDSEFTIQTCLEYESKNTVEPFEVKIQVEVITSVAKLRTESGRYSSHVDHTFTMETKKKYCQEWNARVEHDVTDFQKSVILKMSHSLAMPKLNDTFCSSCPIESPDTKNSDSLTIGFQIDCGDDNVCQADLSIIPTFIGNSPNTPATIGSPPLTLTVVLLNKGETAFGTMLIINFPKELALVNNPENCVQNDDGASTLDCTFGSLDHGDEMALEMLFDTVHVPPGTTKLNLEITLETSSTLVNPSVGITKIPLYLQSITGFRIDGLSYPETIIMGNDTFNQGWISMSHTYQVSKFLATTVPLISVMFAVPSKATPTADSFLRIGSYQVVFGETVVICQEMNRTTPSPSLLDIGYSILDTQSEALTTKGLESLCLGSMTCSYFTCNLGPFTARQSHARFTAEFQINTHIAGFSRMKAHNFITSGMIVVNKTIFEYVEGTLVASVMTTLLPEEVEKKPVPVWVIIVSCLAALFILAMIILILYKIGFFKRKKYVKVKTDDPNEHIEDNKAN